MQREYVPFVFLLFAVVLAVTVLRTPVRHAAGPETAGEAPVASGQPPSLVPSGMPATLPSSMVPPAHSANVTDAPLTEREKKDVSVRLAPGACDVVVKKVNELLGIDEHDRRKLLMSIACLRRGNVAWAKCIEHATSKVDADTCARRLLTAE